MTILSDRYARQITLPEIGADGQAKLTNSKILVVGAGGLGAPVLAYLAGAGVGHIMIIDHDHRSLIMIMINDHDHDQ